MSMLSPRLQWLFGTCGCEGQDKAEHQIQLSSESGSASGRHQLSRGDPLDITFTPRPFGRDAAGSVGAAGTGRAAPITPRQRDVRDQLMLPKLQMYPVPPNAAEQDTEEERKNKLLLMYQEVAMDLHTGMYLTQLTADRDHSDIHCQLMEDMTTLKLDQCNGRIIEFPLTNVSKVYRIVKNEDRFYTPGTPMPAERTGTSEHIVVVEFLRRKLAFVFKEVHSAQRFMICVELLIRRAQQKQVALRSLTPTFPPRQAQTSRQHEQCPTPRQVYDAMSKPGERRSPASPAPGRSL